jgi:hypothetical protein
MRHYPPGMRIFRRPALIFAAWVLVPVFLLFSETLAFLAGAIGLLLLIGNVAESLYASWRDRPLREARLAAVMAEKPSYVAYGSGAPNWLGLPIYICFFAIAVAALAPQVLHPYKLRGFGGYLTWMADRSIFPVAAIAAYAVWRAASWRLRARYPDKLLVAANDVGIVLPSGFVVPYAKVRRIDPYSRGSNGLVNNWIDIEDGQFSRYKIDVNMSVEPPQQILASLRERALAGGANLAPELPNGRRPTVGSQLEYRIGRGWQG